MKTRQDRLPYKPRTIDRAIFAILAVAMLFAGIYVVGPWYLDTPLGTKAPLLSLLSNKTGVKFYGWMLLIDGLALFYATAGRGVHYVTITAYALLAGFLLRLYSFIGVLLTLDSWRPPSYISHGATVLLLGAMWLWVRLSERPSG